ERRVRGRRRSAPPEESAQDQRGQAAHEAQPEEATQDQGDYDGGRAPPGKPSGFDRTNLRRARGGPRTGEDAGSAVGAPVRGFRPPGAFGQRLTTRAAGGEGHDEFLRFDFPARV